MRDRRGLLIGQQHYEMNITSSEAIRIEKNEMKSRRFCRRSPIYDDASIKKEVELLCWNLLVQLQDAEAQLWTHTAGRPGVITS